MSGLRPSAKDEEEHTCGYMSGFITCCSEEEWTPWEARGCLGKTVLALTVGFRLRLCDSREGLRKQREAPAWMLSGSEGNSVTGYFVGGTGTLILSVIRQK